MKFLSQIQNALEDIADGFTELVEKSYEGKREAARAVAEPFGLEVDKWARISGEIDGIGVRRFSKDHGGKNNTDWWTHTVFELAFPLPGFMVARNKNLLDSLAEAVGVRDIQLGNDLDPTLWIRATKRHEDAARTLLTMPDVERALFAVVEAGLRLGLDKAQLTLLKRGHHTRLGPDGIAEGLALARAINDALRAPWESLDAEPLVSLNAEGTCAEGHLEEVPIRIEVRTKDGVTKTRVTGWLDPGLPAKTEIVHTDKLASNQELDDPILDPMVGVISSDIAALRERVCRDEVRGPLLDIVHGFPGSKVLSDKVVLIMPGHASIGLRQRVDTVVELVQALGGGKRRKWPTLPGATRR